MPNKPMVPSAPASPAVSPSRPLRPLAQPLGRACEATAVVVLAAFRQTSVALETCGSDG